MAVIEHLNKVDCLLPIRSSLDSIPWTLHQLDSGGDEGQVLHAS